MAGAISQGNRWSTLPFKWAITARGHHPKTIEELAAEDANATIEPNFFCSKCRSFISGSKTLLDYSKGLIRGSNCQSGEYAEQFRHHSSWKSLETSASFGCHFCALILNNFRPTDRYDIQIVPDKLGGGVRIRPKNWRNFNWAIPLFLSFDKPPALGPLSLSTTSDACFQLAESWLRACKSSHDVCNHTSSLARNVPTRLLDLRPSTSNDMIRLCLTSGIQGQDLSVLPSYLTLSHRWGQVQPLRLLQSNYKEFTESISMDNLPRTFQDTVFITRRLGFRYLWIDSLCIIQDSKEDWDRESAIMGDVYRGSVLTIAALGAKDSRDGLFRNRNPLRHAECNLNAQVTALCKWRELSGELLIRGWVFQERILSPRTIYYASSALGWECLQDQKAEYGWSPVKGTLKQDLIGLRKGGQDFFSIPEDTARSGNFHIFWRRLLSGYSETDITKHDDRLVAIHGIIQTVAQMTGMTPVAGMWEEHLSMELLWQVSPVPDKEDHVATQVINYHAPSWSWVAPMKKIVPGMVFNGSQDWKIHITKVHAPSNPNGQIVSEAYLQLEGPIRRIREHLRLGGWLEIDEDDHIVSGEYQGFPDMKGNLERPELWALWIVRSVRRDIERALSYESILAWDDGLILEPVPRRERTFRRLGIFKRPYYEIPEPNSEQGDFESTILTII